MRDDVVPAIVSEVGAVFASYPAAIRARLLELRQLVFETAAASQEIGPITETLKWSEPAYLTAATKSGSTIRIAWKPKTPNSYGMYFNCRTTLVDDFRTLFSNVFTFEGNRAIVFDVDDDVPSDQLCTCIAMALTYHLNK